MTFNFDLAGSFRDHVYALALVEHWGHLLSVHCLTEVGDYHDVKDPASFQAIGILQEHPAYLQQFYGRGSFPAEVHDSQTDMQIKACASYLEKYIPLLTLDGAIQAQNTGVAAYQAGSRNATYLDRFTQSFQRIRGTLP